MLRTDVCCLGRDIDSAGNPLSVIYVRMYSLRSLFADLSKVFFYILINTISLVDVLLSLNAKVLN
jgi:hypothetical protein